MNSKVSYDNAFFTSQMPISLRSASKILPAVFEVYKPTSILDVGCGTGIAVPAFAKLGVAKVIGLDKSAEMIRRAKTVTVESSTLNAEQKGAIEWRIDDMTNPSACAAGEVSHADEGDERHSRRHSLGATRRALGGSSGQQA